MRIKKQYVKPEVTLFALDMSVTLMMLSNGTPRGLQPLQGVNSKGSNQEPFASPFGDKTFN